MTVSFVNVIKKRGAYLEFSEILLSLMLVLICMSDLGTIVKNYFICTVYKSPRIDSHSADASVRANVS